MLQKLKTVSVRDEHASSKGGREGEPADFLGEYRRHPGDMLYMLLCAYVLYPTKVPMVRSIKIVFH